MEVDMGVAMEVDMVVAMEVLVVQEPVLEGLGGGNEKNEKNKKNILYI